MDSITFTINLKDLNDSDNEDELKCIIESLRLLIKFLMNANPNYYLIGNMLNDQLDEQVKQHEEEVDPRKKFLQKLDDYRPIVIDGSDPNLSALYHELCDNIGEAMGPITYAAFRLVKYLEEQHFDSGTRWVWDFVKYYEENWKF